MASSAADKEVEMASSAAEKGAEIPYVCLPAPSGWTKKLAVQKGRRTRRRSGIVFVSPTGDEIRNKRQLEQYIKSHPGGPAFSEFDWGTGNAPRRSARISDKVKTIETPEDEPPKKRAKKFSEKKDVDEKTENKDGENEASDDAEMEEAEEKKKKNEEAAATEAAAKANTVKTTDEENEKNEHPNISQNGNDAKTPSHEETGLGQKAVDDAEMKEEQKEKEAVSEVNAAEIKGEGKVMSEENPESSQIGNNTETPPHKETGPEDGFSLNGNHGKEHWEGLKTSEMMHSSVNCEDGQLNNYSKGPSI